MGQVRPMLPATKSELAPLKLQNCTNSELAFTEALQEPRISSLDKPDTVLDALLAVMHKLGIRAHNLPDKKALAVLVHFVIKRYRGHTVSEISLAFDMAMVGEFDGDFKCYENFSCEYVSSVMRAYRKWASQEFKQIPTLPPVPKKTESMSDFAMLRWLAREIRFIRTGKPIELVSHQLYDYLDKRGKINATKEEKWAYFQKAIAYREIQLQKEWQDRSSADTYNAIQGFRQMRIDRSFTESEYEGLQRIAKKLLFFDLVLKQSPCKEPPPIP